MGRDRNDHGKYDDRIPPETVLDVFNARQDRARPLTAGDITEEMEIARRTAHNKLNALVERGELETRKVGARGRVWWTPDRGDETGADGERRGSAETTLDNSDPDVDASKDPIYELDLPGYGMNLEGRQAAVRAIYEYLTEHGSGQRSDFQEVVNVEATGYKSFNSFYTNCMDNGGVLAELPGVQSPGEGGHTYTYAP